MNLPSTTTYLGGIMNSRTMDKMNQLALRRVRSGLKRLPGDLSQAREHLGRSSIPTPYLANKLSGCYCDLLFDRKVLRIGACEGKACEVALCNGTCKESERRRRPEQRTDGARACGLSEYRYAGRISAKRSDVGMYPLERRDLDGIQSYSWV